MRPLPATLAAVLLLAALPSALAAPEPLATLDVKSPKTAPDDPRFLLRVGLHAPSAPAPSADGTEDCARDDRPRSPLESVMRLAAPLYEEPPAPGETNGVHRWFPTCVAVATGARALVCAVGVCPHATVAGAPAAYEEPYVAYDLSRGVYYVALAPGAPGSAGDGPVSVQADCEDCPPFP